MASSAGVPKFTNWTRGRVSATISALLSTTALVVAGSAVLATTQAISSGQALAQEQAGSAAHSFDIPAQPLSSAVSTFGRQSGMQVTLSAASSAGVTTNAVSGTYEPAQALSRLLEGTGVTYRITPENTVVIGSAPADAVALADGSILLETITVQGDLNTASGAGFQGTPDWVYDTPAPLSVISRDAIQSAAGARDPRDLLGNVAGAYVNSSVANSPAIAPNIRGVQDMGRVVLSIDGARQNANRTISAGSDSYVGGSGKGFVDPAFIRAVEVNRSTGPGVGLAGSLGGAVTFRTVGADDLIDPDRNWGIETNTTLGTNNQYFQGSVLGAARLGDTPFSLVAGLSHQNLGEYRVGQHGTVEWSGEDSGETSLMGRNNWSSLLKLEGDFGDVQTALSWTHQEKSFAWSQGIDSAGSDEWATVDTLTASLDWDPGDNDLIDLHAKVWLNNTAETTLRHARGAYPLSGYPATWIDGDFLSFGVNVDNTSWFDTPAGDVTLNYGLEAFRDQATSSADNEAIAAWPELEDNFTSFSPAGRRDMVSGFLNADWEPTEWVTLSAGLRYDWYRLQGSSTYYRLQPAVTYYASCDISRYDYALAYDPASVAGLPPFLIAILRGQCGEVHDGDFYQTGSEIAALNTPRSYPGTVLDIDRSDGALLPSATVEFKPLDWFRPYISYSQSYRPPAIAEAFFSGDLPQATNPGTGYAPNDALQPETAETWEVGANISLDGVFTGQDSLRVKISAFDRTIEDYIAIGYFFPAPGSPQYTGYVNTIDATHMQGVEIEGNYDAGGFWIGGSATWLETDWAQKVPASWYDQPVSSDDVQMYTGGSVPPRFKGTVDAGVRLFEDRLALGARLTHVTPTLSQVETLDPDGAYLTSEYTKLDLYGSYELTDNATLRIGIDNVTDINHVPAGSRYPAPGRTFFATLNVRF